MVDLFGRDMFGAVKRAPKAGPLADRFGIPPFSVLDARQGYWQERKRAWLSFGIKSELGRVGAGSGLVMSATIQREKPSADQALKHGEEGGTSIFDPVLCELAYRWFSPLDGLILDPFAGGSVRGLTAAMLGRRYLGNDLRAEQIEANRAQVPALRSYMAHEPEWTCGDSADPAWTANRAADLVFSCPPYGDLERYSDDPADLSAMDYPSFLCVYGTIIANACAALKPDRFAVFVIGDFRCPKGFYRNFPAATIEAFEAAGLRLYNEAILLTAIGSLPLRINRQFTAGRKLGKTHQNVYVFVKGDPKRAADACGQIEEG